MNKLAIVLSLGILAVLIFFASLIFSANQNTQNQLNPTPTAATTLTPTIK